MTRNRAVAKPCNRNLRHAVAGLLRYRFDGRDDSTGPLLLRHEILHHFAVHAALFWRAVAVILSGQHAAGQGRPRREAEVQGFCHRDQFPLDASLDQAVFNLQASKGRPSAQLGKCIRLGDPPGRGIRNPDVEHLALANQVIQPSHHFFDRRDLVPDVDPIQVDVVGLQPPEARFHSLHHILTLIAGRIRIGARSGSRVFRGQHHTLAMVLHKLAEKRFARPIGVRVGGVDEIPPRLAKGVVHPARLVLDRTPAPFLAEGRGAERGLRNPESGVAQKSVFHVKSPFRYGVFILEPLMAMPVAWNRQTELSNLRLFHIE